MTPHKKIIDDLVNLVPGFRKTGMVKSLIAAFAAVDDDFGFDVPVAFVPDGYVIDLPGKKITLYEVVCSNDLSDTKVKKLLNFWFDMDSCSWSTEVKIVRGHLRLTQTLPDEQLCDLFNEWNPWLGEDVHPTPKLLAAGQYDLA